MEKPRECKHLGNPPWQDSGGGGGASKWGFSRKRPKANNFIPLFNTSKRGDAKFTREGTTDTKPRTPSSSARQIYGKVPEKNSTPHFAKVLIAVNKTTKDMTKYGGNLHGKRDMCMDHILENSETHISRSIIHKQNNWMHNMQLIYTQ